MRSASSFVDALIHALLVNRETDRFDECPDRAGSIRVRQKNAVDARRQDLVEHPCIGPH